MCHSALFLCTGVPRDELPTALAHDGWPPYLEPTMTIRVLIIDEHEAARKSLARRLANLNDLRVVQSTGDAAEGLRWVEELHPDVVLLDPKMKRADGMEVCRQACAWRNGAKVTVLTSFSDPEERREAIRVGVYGYLLKDLDTSKLAQWIKYLAADKVAQFHDSPAATDP